MCTSISFEPPSHAISSLLVYQKQDDNVLRAPMPGVVKSVLCKVGDEVEVGMEVLTLEAMKMQMPLFAPNTGKVTALYVKVNDNLMDDDIIMEVLTPERPPI